MQHGDDHDPETDEGAATCADDAIRFAKTPARLRPDIPWLRDIIAGFRQKPTLCFENSLKLVTGDFDLAAPVFPYSAPKQHPRRTDAAGTQP